MGTSEFGWQEMIGAPTSNSEDYAAAAPLNRLKRRVIFQTWIIAILGTLLTLFIPFARPNYLYYAMTPEKTKQPLVGLDMPNMTNRAIISWATTSITEVMTMGFGDMDTKVLKQRPRFTAKGWDVYMKTFKTMKIRETFKQSQLVLTTVPTNTPVIVEQGVNFEENVYQWVVQMPVIMTYATNNNVTRKQRSIITLTIVRIPAEENYSGIAIRNWEQG
jgi:hypothetical protein